MSKKADYLRLRENGTGGRQLKGRLFPSSKVYILVSKSELIKRVDRKDSASRRALIVDKEFFKLGSVSNDNLCILSADIK